MEDIFREESVSNRFLLSEESVTATALVTHSLTFLSSDFFPVFLLYVSCTLEDNSPASLEQDVLSHSIEASQTTNNKRSKRSDWSQLDSSTLTSSNRKPLDVLVTIPGEIDFQDLLENALLQLGINQEDAKKARGNCLRQI